MTLHPSSRKFRRPSAGLTILEMLIALTLVSIVFATVASFAAFTARSFVATGNYADLDRASRNALDALTRDIRESRELTSFTTNKLTLTANDMSIVTFEYSPSKATLTRKQGAESSVLLEQCDFLKFVIYQRKPMAGLQFYPATNIAGASDPSIAKLIDVSWRCSRKILALKVNTESVQTAKIVIRN